jgi:hypothetical protein
LEFKALPPKGHSVPATRLSSRVLARLAQAEVSESNPHYRDDLTIAKLTVLYAWRGAAVLCSPHVLASYAVLGLHPDKVWPAIEARRIALIGSEKFSGGKLPPKKPPVAVSRSQQKLWFEKTNGARVLGSRAVIPSSGEPAISVPMAAPSIAALYPKSDAPSSAKTRGFTYDEMCAIVQYSGAEHSVRAGTLSALRARGPWPNEDGVATGVICVSLIGMTIEGVCCRRTAQRRIKRAMNLHYWRRLRDANSWTNCPKCGKARTTGKCDACPYRGRSKDANGNWTGEFMRVPVYEIDIQKFRSAPRCREIRHFDARTYAEYKAAAKRGEHPNVLDISARKPTQPAPPQNDPPPTKAAPVQQPAAEHHRSTVRPEPKPAQPRMTRREAAKFMANVEQLKRGRTGFFSRADGMNIALHPGEQGYSPPIPWKVAFEAECAQWKRDPQVVRDALKFWGYKLPEES